jgi:hypothetical protein
MSDEKREYTQEDVNAQLADPNSEFWQLFSVLRDFDPFTALVVNAHLLVEEHLNRALDHLLKRPDLFPKVTFYNRLLILKSLSGYREEATEWKMIEVLNNLRNQFAHSLEREKKDSLLANLKGLLAIESGSNYAEVPDHKVVGISCVCCVTFLRCLDERIPPE